FEKFRSFFRGAFMSVLASILAFLKKWKTLLLIIFIPFAGVSLLLLALISSHPGAGTSFKIMVYQWWNNIFKGGDPFLLIEKGDLSGLEKLLKSHPEMAMEREPARGATPLHTVQDVPTAQLLLDHGAEIDAELSGYSGATTPLFDAIYGGRTELALFLIDKGADIKKLNDFNRTPLHVAASCGDVEVTAALLKKGADPTFRGPRTGDLTPPQEAAFNGKLPVLQHFYEQGVSFDLTETLFISISPRNNSVNRFLLDTGKIDVNAQNKYGSTLLHESASFGNHEVFRLLLERGADPERPDKDGKRVIDQLKDLNFSLLDQSERDRILKILEEFKN
ncbi:MAG: ankyrin repeat domain-containing protein, partial [Candidatus Riflebacteria bacterium]